LQSPCWIAAVVVTGGKPKSGSSWPWPIWIIPKRSLYWIDFAPVTNQKSVDAVDGSAPHWVAIDTADYITDGLTSGCSRRRAVAS
jgi:hypothetical protein